VLFQLRDELCGGRRAFDELRIFFEPQVLNVEQDKAYDKRTTQLERRNLSQQLGKQAAQYH